MRNRVMPIVRILLTLQKNHQSWLVFLFSACGNGGPFDLNLAEASCPSPRHSVATEPSQSALFSRLAKKGGRFRLATPKHVKIGRGVRCRSSWVNRVHLTRPSGAAERDRSRSVVRRKTKKQVSYLNMQVTPAYVSTHVSVTDALSFLHTK